MRALAKLGFEAVGVDFAPEAVERARALTEQAGLKATFAQADVLALAGVLGTCGLWVEHTASAPSIPLVTDSHGGGADALAGRPAGGAVLCPRASGRSAVHTTEEEVRRRFQPGFEIELLERATDLVERRRARSSWPASAADPRHLSPAWTGAEIPGKVECASAAVDSVLSGRGIAAARRPEAVCDARVMTRTGGFHQHLGRHYAGDTTLDVPTLVGSEGERGIDISSFGPRRTM